MFIFISYFNLSFKRPYILLWRSILISCSSLTSDWTCLSPFISFIGYFLHLNSIVKFIHYIFSLDFVNFKRSILIDESVDVHEATSYSYLYLIAFVAFYVNSFLAKLVYTLAMSQKHYFQFGLLGKIVYIFA